VGQAARSFGWRANSADRRCTERTASRRRPSRAGERQRHRRAARAEQRFPGRNGPCHPGGGVASDRPTLTVQGGQIQLEGVREKNHELAQTRPKHAFYAVPRSASGCPSRWQGCLRAEAIDPWQRRRRCRWRRSWRLPGPPMARQRPRPSRRRPNPSLSLLRSPPGNQAGNQPLNRRARSPPRPRLRRPRSPPPAEPGRAWPTSSPWPARRRRRARLPPPRRLRSPQLRPRRRLRSPPPPSRLRPSAARRPECSETPRASSPRPAPGRSRAR